MGKVNFQGAFPQCGQTVIDEPSATVGAALTKPMFLQVGTKRYEVATFEQASQMFCIARDKSGDGASKIKTPLIVDEVGSAIGYVAYNGRVFEGTPQAWSGATRLLYENRVA